jgi:hypothetical protein
MMFFGSVNSFASCSKWEYAKFKDASKKELINEYCYTVAMAALDGELVKLARDGRSMGIKTAQDVREAEESQLTCLGQADEAASMLEKKYKAKAPTNCPKK